MVEPVVLHSWQAVKRSYGFVFGNLGAALRVCWLYGLIFLALEVLVATWLGDYAHPGRPADTAGEQGTAKGGAPILLAALGLAEMLIVSTLAAAIAVPWMRKYLLAEPVPSVFPPINKQVLGFAVASIGLLIIVQLLFFGVSFLFGFVIGFLIGVDPAVALDVEKSLRVIPSFIVFFSCIYILCRTALVFPNQALSNRLDWKKSMTATSGRVVGFFAGAVLVTIPIIAVLFIFLSLALLFLSLSPSGSIDEIIESSRLTISALFKLIIGTTVLLVLATYLAECYRQLLPPPDEVKHLVPGAPAG